MNSRFIQTVLFLWGSFVTIASSQNNVRLVGGSNLKEGRVEIFHDSEWGTICTNSWDDQDASVICRELGLGTTGEDVNPDSFGVGDGRIWLDNVRCTGFESRLDECVSDGWGNHGCALKRDAAVRCLDIVRLVGEGNSTNEGRVEVYYDGQWGTVCDDVWVDLHATVVCRELGLGSSGEAVRKARFGRGTGPIWLDDIACTGEESSLYMCRHNGWGVHNCKHKEDAGVICGEFARVVNGSYSSEGRVEVFRDGEWGTVCDDYWSDADATVVCRQLGLGDYGEAIGNAAFGEGNGTIWLGDVYCTGSEKSLYICRISGWNSSDCNHDEDAGVKCYRHVTSSSPVAAPTENSQTDTSVYNNHPVVFVVISLLVVAVIVLAVYIVILRRKIEHQDGEGTERSRSIYDCLASPIRIAFARKRETSEKENNSQFQVGNANQNDSTRGQSDDQEEVYNAAYESSGANYPGRASAKSDEEDAHVYNRVEAPPDKGFPLETGVGNTNGARDGGSQADYEVGLHDGNSVKDSSGDTDSYQYVEY